MGLKVAGCESVTVCYFLSCFAVLLIYIGSIASANLLNRWMLVMSDKNQLVEQEDIEAKNGGGKEPPAVDTQNGGGKEPPAVDTQNGGGKEPPL
ncbi:hypothetical protein TUM3792_23830 [Shewanella sp. MBTL60-007]|nr:hypothetical protein TUM3792_23830 [Shewanella sp. MBTL60-007]